MASPRDPANTATLEPLADTPADQLAAVEVVATDVDGTLTRGGKLGAELLEGFAKLAAQGLRVIPISGRPAGEVLGLCRYLPGVEFGVAENGLLELVPDRAPRWLGEPTDAARLRAVGEHLNRAHGAGLELAGDAFCRVGDVAYERAGREPDKGAGLLRLLGDRGIDAKTVATVGDAPNDAGLFEPGRFALTVGTADVPAQRRWFAHLPERVAAEREVAGFLELVELLCQRR